MPPNVWNVRKKGQKGPNRMFLKYRIISIPWFCDITLIHFENQDASKLVLRWSQKPSADCQSYQSFTLMHTLMHTWCTYTIMFTSITIPGRCIWTLMYFDIRLMIFLYRCTMVNLSSTAFKQGLASYNEMCDLYLIYYVESDAENDLLTESNFCWSPGPPETSWYSLGLRDIPTRLASSLP